MESHYLLFRPIGALHLIFIMIAPTWVNALPIPPEPAPAYYFQLKANYPYLCEYAAPNGMAQFFEAHLDFESNSGQYGM